MNLSSLVIPGLLAGVAVYGMGRRVDVYGALTTGARDGLTVMLNILPPLVGLLTAVAMFRASGAMEWLSTLCAPLLERLGIPPEATSLMLIRPVSGNGALAVATDLIAANGPDSYIGRVAAVMLGSGALAVATDLMRAQGPDSYSGRVAAVMLGRTETAFCTIAVYFGSAGIHRTRHTIPAALAADLTGFIASAFAVRLFFGT